MLLILREIKYWWIWTDRHLIMVPVVSHFAAAYEYLQVNELKSCSSYLTCFGHTHWCFYAIYDTLCSVQLCVTHISLISLPIFQLGTVFCVMWSGWSNCAQLYFGGIHTLLTYYWNCILALLLRYNTYTFLLFIFLSFSTDYKTQSSLLPRVMTIHQLQWPYSTQSSYSYCYLCVYLKMGKPPEIFWICVWVPLALPQWNVSIYLS